MSAPLPQALRDYAQLAEPRLAAFLDEKGAELRKLPVDLSRAHAALRDYVLRGGKRLRGALVLLGHEAAGGAREAALSASLGIELLHAYLLIHDDFMDRDELRRGGPTLHVALGRAPGASGHLGASLAILAGSPFGAWALELVLKAPVAPARALAAARHLARALADVTIGQMLDVAAPLGPELSARGVLKIEELKTGSYTFELPLVLGAQLGGAGEGILAALRGYARPLGQAFQIADDLLGTFGAPEVTGKSSANDLREGKRTLLIARALEQAPAADAAALRAGLGRPGMTDAEAEGLRDILRRSGAEAAARAEAQRLGAQALAALEGNVLPAAVAEGLRAIAEYAVRRSR